MRLISQTLFDQLDCLERLRRRVARTKVEEDALVAQLRELSAKLLDLREEALGSADDAYAASRLPSSSR
jgi:uncharacterized coiled-coil protein SlyX